MSILSVAIGPTGADRPAPRPSHRNKSASIKEWCSRVPDISARLNAGLADRYREILTIPHLYSKDRGPDTQKNIEEYRSWLYEEGAAPSRAIACSVGTERLLRLTNTICWEAYRALKLERYGYVLRDGDDCPVVAAARIICHPKTGCIEVIGDQSRSNLRGEATYDDKCIELVIDKSSYRVRVIDSSDTFRIGTKDGKDLAEESQGAAQRKIMRALRKIHKSIEAGTTELELHFFNRGINHKALAKLNERLI